jgi:transcription initiation factor TFIIE subunit alpha
VRETLVDKYEDPFVRIATMIGGDEYLKVARSLLKAEDATDEEIASSTGLRINMVRKVLYDLFGKSLITGIRVKDERKGWFVYRWRSRRDEVENFIENQKKKIGERLQQRLDYENSTEFYHCGNEDCSRITFEDALDAMFKCPSCSQVVNLKKNDTSKKAFAKKIDEIVKDMQQTF